MPCVPVAQVESSRSATARIESAWLFSSNASIASDSSAIPYRFHGAVVRMNVGSHYRLAHEADATSDTLLK